MSQRRRPDHHHRERRPPTALETVACPEAGCDVAAEVTERFVLESTDGPTEHVTVRCVRRHVFRMPTARLAAA